MRGNMRFKLNQPSIPRDYRPILLSFFKAALKNVGAVHDYYNINEQKSFAFAVKLPNPVFADDIDLVFYNFILKCFVLIDLKTEKISHQDVGQMDMYIRMYDEMKRSEGDNPSIGIVLCSICSRKRKKVIVAYHGILATC